MSRVLGPVLRELFARQARAGGGRPGARILVDPLVPQPADRRP